MNLPKGLLELGGIERAPRPATVKKVVRLFLDRDLAENTKRAFTSDLKPFVEALGDVPVTRLDGDTLRSHLTELQESRSLSDASYNRRLGTLKNLFNWLDRLAETGTPRVTDRLMGYRNPIGGLVKKRLPRRLVRPLSKEHVETILGRMNSLRDIALFTVLYDSGMRVQEALKLNVEEMDLEDGSARIIGKGGVERVVFLSQRGVHRLKRYLRDRGGPRFGPVFVSRQFSDGTGNRLSYAMAYRLFRDYSEGVLEDGDQPTIHQLRHAFGSERAGVIDALALKQLMGHKSLRTTLQYAEVNPEAARDAFRRFEAARAKT